MINKNFLILASLSTLLVTTALGAEKDACVGGACMATGFTNPQPSRSFTAKKQKIEQNFQYNESDNLIPIILDGQLINIFPSYEMQDAEVYPLEEELIIVESIQKIEDIILVKTGLSNSEYFCDFDNEKLPVYEKNSDVYVCV